MKDLVEQVRPYLRLCRSL